MRYVWFAWLFMLMISGQSLYGQQQLSTKSAKAMSLYKDAISKANQRAYDQAIALLNMAIKEDDHFIEATIMLGEVYGDNMQDSLAILTLRKAIALDQADPLPCLHRIALPHEG